MRFLDSSCDFITNNTSTRVGAQALFPFSLRLYTHQQHAVAVGLSVWKTEEEREREFQEDISPSPSSRPLTTKEDLGREDLGCVFNPWKHERALDILAVVSFSFLGHKKYNTIHGIEP